MIKNKVSKVKVLKTTPSDHFLIQASVDISVPKVYVDKHYFLDPTRRPPIPKKKLWKVNFDISQNLPSETFFKNNPSSICMEKIISVICDVCVCCIVFVVFLMFLIFYPSVLVLPVSSK